MDTDGDMGAKMAKANMKALILFNYVCLVCQNNPSVHSG